MGSRRTGGWNISLVGASTLQGKEVKAVFEERKHPGRRLKLVDGEDVQGLLTDFEGEPTILQPISADTFEEQDLVIFASGPSFTSLHWQQAQASGCCIIDLSYSLESESQAAFAAPLIDSLWDGALGGNGLRTDFGTIIVSPHPMSIVLAGALKLLSRRFKVVRAVANVFEPASVRGQAGIEELHQQTVNLLSFQEIPKKVFDAQLSFNLLAEIGKDSHPSLCQEQERIANHLRRLLRGSAPQPALRLLQVPVFHGYSFSLWVELAESYPVEEIESALRHNPFSPCGSTGDQPSAVSAASSDSILVGTIEQDSANPSGYGIWGAFDNLRIAALNAMRITEDLMGLTTGVVALPSGPSNAPPQQS
jgi:aspartate-semialdehyde dehydrogenase